jgi:serine/threonine-protein kinase
MALHGEFVADCVIFLTHQLGERSIDAFNKFGLDVATREIPAVVLLGEKQAHLKSQLQLAAHRVSLALPLRMKELRATLLQLLGPANPA